MKKLLMVMWGFVVSMLALTPMAFADSGLDINKVLTDSIVGIAVIVLPALAALLGKLLVNKIKESKTQVDDRLAAIAVAWAEDQVEKNGSEKLDAAARKLSELSKGRISYENAKTLSAAMYQRLKGELHALKK